MRKKDIKAFLDAYREYIGVGAIPPQYGQRITTTKKSVQIEQGGKKVVYALKEREFTLSGMKMQEALEWMVDVIEVAKTNLEQEALLVEQVLLAEFSPEAVVISSKEKLSPVYARWKDVKITAKRAKKRIIVEEAEHDSHCIRTVICVKEKRITEIEWNGNAPINCGASYNLILFSQGRLRHVQRVLACLK